jgi:hypothetical protein
MEMALPLEVLWSRECVVYVLHMNVGLYRMTILNSIETTHSMLKIGEIVLGGAADDVTGSIKLRALQS